MRWWKTAHVGQKVVCVPSASVVRHDGQIMNIKSPVVVGRVYTIKAIEIRPIYDEPSFDIGLEDPVYGIWWVHHTRFRPVQPKSTETGMAIIRKILDRVPVKEDA